MQKKATYTTLFCVCMLLLNFTAIAQTRIVAVENDGTEPIEYFMDEEMNVNFTTPSINVANLIPAFNGYQLPTGSASMFLEFKINGVVYEFFPLQQFNYSNSVNGYPVYSSISEDFSVNFEEICPSVFTGTYIFEMTWSVVTSSGSIYPIHDTQYSNPNGIFSCRVFTITCPDCGPPKVSKGLLFRNNSFVPACPPISSYNTDPVGTAYGTTGCSSNARPGKSTNPPLADMIQIGEQKDQQSGLMNKASITPNPFDGAFQLNYQLEMASKVNIAVFNSNGQLMVQFDRMDEAKQQQLTIDAHQWPNGIYHCRIKTPQQSQVLRMVKSH